MSKDSIFQFYVLLLFVLNPLWHIGHQQSLLSAVCFWLLISAFANFSQAFLSLSPLFFSMSGTIHQELFLNHQTDSPPSPCVLYCLQLYAGCGQSKPISAFSSDFILVLRSSSSFLIRFGQKKGKYSLGSDL